MVCATIAVAAGVEAAAEIVLKEVARGLRIIYHLTFALRSIPKIRYMCLRRRIVFI